jgi:hypothetical protein
MAGTKIYYISGKKPRVGTVSWNSTPLLDGWGWGDYWDCATWVEWHKALVTHYGKSVANSMFIEAWGKQDSTAGPYNWCKYGSAFANYFSSQGIDVGWLLSHLVTGTSTVIDNVTNTVVDTSSGVATVGKVVKYVLPFAAIGVGIWAFDKYVKKIF